MHDQEALLSSEPGQPLAWHALERAAVEQALGANAEQGLAEEEVPRRLARYGPNALADYAHATWYQVLGRQFTEVLVLILVIAAAVSFLVGHLVDGITILVIVFLNGVLGFVQEWKAERAIEALRQMLTPHARVRRGGHVVEVDARSLVPGDLVLLEVGDRVPSDVRILDEIELEVDESLLTGESLPVAKQAEAVPTEALLAERHAMAWMGTLVTNGRAQGLVTATGMQTEFGRIAHLTGTVEDERTPLQKKLGLLGRQLGFIAVAVSAMIALAGWLMGKGLLEMFMTGVSLAVAVVPEGLPAVVTITLALGIRAMVQRNVLLRRLPAAEAIGAATVICTDKTGTLTQNEMTVQEIWLPGGAVALTGVGYDPEGHFEQDGQKIDYHTRPDLLALLKTALRCNHAEVHRDETGWHMLGDPTEASLVVAAYKAWLSPETKAPRAEFAFSSERKCMTIVDQEEEGLIAHIKGAPEVILSRCTSILEVNTVQPLTEERRHEAVAAYQQLAAAGQRTLALACRTMEADVRLEADAVEQDLTLLGIVGIMDPPRPEVPEAIEKAQEAGIRVILITGDAPETALAVGTQIGLGVDHALTGADLVEMDDASLEMALCEHVLFARTAPEHKLRIVSRLQEQGEVVGMTGDGVNDAPALKKADIGIAMGQRGTDAAQGASDMVLTDDNFASIMRGVEEGRRQYESIQKFVRYLLTSNTGEVLAIFGGILLGGPLVLLPVQILWMNLVTDGVTAVALGLEPAEPGTMRQPPRDPKAPILGWRWWLILAAIGSYLALAALFLFNHYLGRGGAEAITLAQTVAFTSLVIMEKVNVFNFRSLRDPLHTVGFFSNPWLLLAVAGSVGLQVAAIYVPFLQTALQTVPLGWSDWMLIALVAAPVFLVPEAIKLVRSRSSKSHL